VKIDMTQEWSYGNWGADFRKGIEGMIDERLDRTTIKRTSLAEAEADDIEYWMAKTPTERIEALEYLRRWVYGDDQIDAGLQRVLTTARIGED
jgi:hypothetical protein